MNTPSRNDTVGQGFGIGCLAMFAGLVACAALGGVLGFIFGTLGVVPDSSGPFVVLVWLVMAVVSTLPLVAPIVMAVRLRNQGRPQASKGVWMALLSAFALGVLLVAGCFGLLATADFR